MCIYADTVLKNGNFYSVSLDGTLTRAQAAAIKDGLFAYVGTDEGAEPFISEKTKVLDLGGKMVLPGMSDAHIHASWGGLLTKSIDLYDVIAVKGYGPQDYVDLYKEKIQEYMGQNPDCTMIRGAGFKADLFMAEGRGFPTKADLDEISLEKPIVLRSYCFHYAWVNSKVLEMAGITRDTPEPYNGKIMRDRNGEPTGFFQEMSAIDLIVQGVKGYDFSVEEYKANLKEYEGTLANGYGITMIFDALATPNAAKAYEELAEASLLNMRVKGCYYADPEKGPEQFEGLSKKSCGDCYEIHTVKFFMDGTGEAFYMNEPFEQEFLVKSGLRENYRGYPIWKRDEMNAAFLKVVEAGLQIHVHCMGDGAVTQTLDGFEYVKEKLGHTGYRNVIAHIMMIKEEDKKRMADLNVVAAIMPCWMCVEGLQDSYYIPMFGWDRSEKRYPLKSLKDAGVIVTAGTDFPVTAAPNPFCEMQYAMTRSVSHSYPTFEEFQGRVLGSGQTPGAECFSFKEIVQSLTIAGAFQHGIDDITGSIEVGKSADLVVLSQNPEEIPTLEIENTVAELTLFQGRVVYRRS